MGDEPKQSSSDGWMCPHGVGGWLSPRSFFLPLLPTEDTGMGAESPIGRPVTAHSLALLHKELCLLMGFFPRVTVPLGQWLKMAP